MRRTSPRRYSLYAVLLRIDRAAGQLNPYLAVVAIGLLVLNLTCLVLLAAHVPVTRHSSGGAATSAGIRVVAPGAGTAPRSGI